MRNGVFEVLRRRKWLVSSSACGRTISKIGEIAVVLESEKTAWTCQKYTFSVLHEGRLTLWLTDEENLFPFHLLRSNVPAGYHHREWSDEVAKMLRHKKLFPVLAILTEEENAAPDEGEPATPAQEISRWEVTQLHRAPLKKTDPPLFAIPENIHLLNH